jgi:glycosyltransferase involved in cell wall biosynthesis
VTPWLIAAGDFTLFGGMDQANYALAAHLARSGADVHLVAHRVSPELAATPNVTVHKASRPFEAHLLGAPLLARETARRAAALTRDARVLINGGNATLAAPTWVHYLHAAHVPVSAGSLRSRVSSALGRRYYLRQERGAISRSPLIICNSQRTADDVVRRYGVGAERTRVVYYGVAANRFSPVSEDARRSARRTLGLAENGTTAAFIGALGDRRKGFDVLFEAWRLLAAQTSWDVELVAVGTGRERDAWIKRAADAAFPSPVRFLGFRGDVDVVLAAADVLVHPARYEPYGLGVQEALCRGVPAIISRACGIAERYPAELRDLIVMESDARALASTLQAWASQKREWAERVAPFGARLRSRTWDDMAAEIVAAVERA